jgi:hypothetical protein
VRPSTADLVALSNPTPGWAIGRSTTSPGGCGRSAARAAPAALPRTPTDTEEFDLRGTGCSSPPVAGAVARSGRSLVGWRPSSVRAPCPGRSEPGPSCGPPGKPQGVAAPTRDALTPQEARIAHLAAPGRRIRRSPRSCSYRAAPWSTTCARYSPSSVSRAGWSSGGSTAPERTIAAATAPSTRQMTRHACGASPRDVVSAARPIAHLEALPAWGSRPWESCRASLRASFPRP